MANLNTKKYQYIQIGIASPEEIAYHNGWITMEQLEKAVKLYGKSLYGKHLRNVAEGRYIY